MATNPDGFDLLELLAADHAGLSDLLQSPDLAAAVAKHLSVERELLYPLVKKHRVVSGGQIDEMHSLDRDLEQTVKAHQGSEVGRALESHIQVQEALFDLVRGAGDRDALLRAGQEVPLAMEMAPTHIHPHLPDHGPIEPVGSEIAAAIDHAEDRLGHDS